MQGGKLNGPLPGASCPQLPEEIGKGAALEGSCHSPGGEVWSRLDFLNSSLELP